MRIKLYSLGCRLNQYEIESILSQLKEKHTLVTEEEPCDVAIVNSCIVTAKSEAKTRNFLSRARKIAPRVILTGCFAQNIEKKENVFYLANDYKYLIPNIIENWENLFLDKLEKKRFDYHPALKSSKTRALIKIQDGCDHFCSYCIIPFTRGKPISRNFQEIQTEFKTLIQAGYKEIVLTGITIGRYYFEGKDLACLIEELLEQEGDFRLHLSSLDPDLLTEKIIQLLKHPKMVKHLHLSLQSASNKILSSMKRKYTQEEYEEKIQSIRAYDSLFHFTTDLIVGFPGEEEIDHKHNLDFVTKIGFPHIHLFRYSDRPLTLASQLFPKVPENIKKQRLYEIQEIVKQNQKKYWQEWQGKKTRILTETKNFGHSDYYLPIQVKNKKLEINDFYTVTINWDKKNLDFLEGVC